MLLERLSAELLSILRIADHFSFVHILWQLEIKFAVPIGAEGAQEEYPTPRAWRTTPSMAANYWESTQRRNWQFTREQLEDLRKKLEDEDQNLVQMYPLPCVRHLSIYFNQRKPPDGCSEPMLISRLYRSCKTWKTPWGTTAGYSNSTALYPPFLFKGRDQTHKSLPGHSHRRILGLQDGRMPASYQNRCQRRSKHMARHVEAL